MDSTNLVTETLAQAGQAATGFTNVLSNGFAGIGQIFWDPAKGLTMAGTLAMIGLGISVVYFGFRFIRSLLVKR